MGRSVLLLFVLAVLCSGCSRYQIREQFDKSLDAYNQSLRWQRWDSASPFISDSIRKEFESRVAATKDIRVVDCQIIGMIYQEETHEALAEVRIDYYNVYSNMMRTILDRQRWVYREEQGRKSWRLMSPLPEFR
ncbi:MAG TPA: hypothetical protein VFG09_12650 [Thermodesulfovibrionales bacterium]|jgi:hypothetical protein|nr:hypothetical protein [Thermodesulfovibrionales bacterium]